MSKSPQLVGTRIQTVIRKDEREIFEKWCRRRGHVKRDGRVNVSAGLAFLIRRAIDIEVSK